MSVHGPRRFERSGLLRAWRLTSAEPCAAVPLDYRLAYGGCWSVPAKGDALEQDLYKPDNPAGTGWLPSPTQLHRLPRAQRRALQARIHDTRTLPAPRLEAPGEPVTHPRHRLAAHGFGPVARWCEPRIRHAGTLDAAWQRETYPRLPRDFDLRFYQAAPPGLICPDWLVGNESVGLDGLLPEGPLRMQLPGVHLLVAATRRSGTRTVGRMALDTVALDLDARQATLVWRASYDRDDPVQRLAIGALSLKPSAGHRHG